MVASPSASETDLNDSEFNDEDWINRCQICGEDSASGLVLCDGDDGQCGNAYHYQCMGLSRPPSEEKWLCAECRSMEIEERQSDDSLWTESSEGDNSVDAEKSSENGNSDNEETAPKSPSFPSPTSPKTSKLDSSLPEKPIKRPHPDPPNPSDFKQFVTDIVRTELGPSPEPLSSKVHYRQLLSRYPPPRLTNAIIRADAGALRRDKRSVLKMKARVKTAIEESE